VVGIGDPREYVRSGLVDWWQIDGALRRGGFDPGAGGELLELGAGCGRLTQLFGLYAGRCRVTGCDVDAEAMRWCTDQLRFARFQAIAMQPPMPFDDRTFDAAYAFSVFSHLPEPLHLAWLAELRRVIRPGGVVVVTVHGRHVVDEVVAGRALPRVRERLTAFLPALERDGFAFVPYGKLDGGRPENAAFFADWDLERYGDSFVLERHVQSRWCDGFELVAHVAAPDAWQDYVILRRR
jgi:SAM-dependent methyltransferase